MCGRFATFLPPAEAVRHFALPPELLGDPAAAGLLAPRYNIAPTQAVAVVREREEDGEVSRDLTPLRWGLVPGWAKDKSIGNKMINARSETAADKPSFRAALARRRCLVPASGFYEWRRTGGGKVPHFFFAGDDEAPAPLAFAGLWETNTRATGEVLETFTILTGGPYAAVRTVHDRSPVILPPDLFDDWLDPALTETAAVRDLLAAAGDHGGADLVARPVSPAVNSPRHDGPELVLPA